jgi:hypothetical protein
MTDERWWAANAGLLTQVLDEDAYLLAVRVGGWPSRTSSAWSPRDMWSGRFRRRTFDAGCQLSGLGWGEDCPVWLDVLAR